MNFWAAGRVAGGALAVFALAGCTTIDGQANGPATRATTAATTTAATSAGATTTATTSARTTTAATAAAQAATAPLHTLFESDRSVGSNGRSLNAILAGVSYPTSTGMWVGCEREAATTTYLLGDGFTRLQAVAGLQPHTPDALVARVKVSGDDRVLQEFLVDATDTVAVDVDVRGVERLEVSAIAVDGALCVPASVPYGALGDARLTR